MKIRACRIVLNNGQIIMYYFHNGKRGVAFAGYKNHNFDDIWDESYDEFLYSCYELIEENEHKDCVESIEVF